MRKSSVTLLFCIFWAVSGHAAPSSISVSGTVSSQQNITISGSDFGSHALQVESLHSNIEAGTVGAAFAKTGWVTNSSYQLPVYSSSYAHSGTKSVQCSPNEAETYNCILTHPVPSAGGVGKKDTPHVGHE